MVDGDSMGPGLQLVGARFSNFLLGELSREFKLPILRYCVTLQSVGWACW